MANNSNLTTPITSSSNVGKSQFDRYESDNRTPHRRATNESLGKSKKHR